MRKTMLVLSTAAAVALSTSAFAQERYVAPSYVAPAAGVAAGTIVGLGAYNGWWGSSLLGISLPATTGAAIAGGGVAGIGTAAAVHAVTTPCQGAHMFFGNLFTSSDGCVNGQWVGRGGPRVARVR